LIHDRLVTGMVFAVRALLALIPALTVSFPNKKWAPEIDERADRSYSRPPRRRCSVRSQ
jgi:hypothetical protein